MLKAAITARFPERGVVIADVQLYSGPLTMRFKSDRIPNAAEVFVLTPEQENTVFSTLASHIEIKLGVSKMKSDDPRNR